MKRAVLFVAVVVALSVSWYLLRRPHAPAPAPAAVPTAPKPAPTLPIPALAAPKAALPAPALIPTILAPKPVPAAVAPAPVPAPAPAAVVKPVFAPVVPAPAPAAAGELHKELIPKDIAILNCDYPQDVVAPGSVFGLDIVGSGFGPEFQRMIRLESGSADVRVKDMRLVTANQIHADLEAAASAKTGYCYPTIFIQGLPVFRAAQPYGVVRKGEVLDIKRLGESPDGHTQPFRVITNLDEIMAKQFWVESTFPGLVIKGLQPRLPFAVDGVLSIADPDRGGECGLSVLLFSREIYRRENLVQLVQLEIGRSGWVYRIVCADQFHRPGDAVRMRLVGSGFSPAYTGLLKARAEDLKLRSVVFSYVSPSEIGLSFVLPGNAQERPYEITIAGDDGRVLHKSPGAFTVVPALWLEKIEVSPRAAPGGRGVLRLIGRGLTPDFAKRLQIAVDDFGLRVDVLKFVDASTLAADVSFDPALAPGDYWLHLSVAGQPVVPQMGSVITVGK